MKKIKKAVIPAAGLGTRFLPASKAVPKELIPILDVPTIQLIVDDAIASGIEDILIIISSKKKTIINHFKTLPYLEKKLKKDKKDLLLKRVQNIAKGANIHFAFQQKQLGLGNAISCAKHFTKDEPFVVLLGDDLTFHDRNQPTAIKQCIDVYTKYHGTVVGVQEVERKYVNKYGIIDIKRKLSNNAYLLKNTIEKPSVDKAPSNLAICGSYVFTPDIYKFISKKQYHKQEIQITDAIQKQIFKGKNVYACKFTGKRFDIGSKEGFLLATIEAGLRDKDINKSLISFLKHREIN
ncbi:MAG: UTP--glucose-1-phosphate uridylyltransferase [Mycoplasmataceae bacterium]|jgi:UTP--glucose-1-phosphate uridylyltransferase|nr:UTP--glucose-1-phosphate uridylyltransferase [Mycoplasmataceae bacterium]